MKKKIIYKINLLLIFTLALCCREPYEVESITFEDILVVESTITNELKQQVVKLSRTYILEENESITENNATVWVEDNNSNRFDFSQNADGEYVSDIAFQAVPDLEYTLFINTQDGNEYESTPSILTPESEITNVYPELITNDDGEEGIEIFIDSDNQDNEAQYFRYEYEETYKVVAPHYYFKEAFFSNYTEEIIPPNTLVFFDVEFQERTQEERICYNSNSSIGIIQTSTNDLDLNTVSRFPLLFINKNNGVIRDRYSILVKQFSQSIETYTFYNIVNELGDIGSILSQSQPGYVTGNIKSNTNPSSKVIGFFSVESVTSKRIYFNYEDFGLEKPDYIYDCEVLELDATDNFVSDMDLNERQEIYRLVTTFADENFNYNITQEQSTLLNDIWFIANPECGDCTSVASNIRPEFWED
ncbi:DUF4249 domain-containing protein [Lacinutrix iliipiscaria]|uniref:DUF4249 domain-containing protein n=1 Tax=Lacinutrix iliipiscaria TaxID=1230532 RepID=A0ABW5WP31_9FLAO